MIAELAIALPLILWLGFRLVLPSGCYEFDFDPQVRGTFISILPHYTKFFYWVVALGMAGAVAGSYWGATTAAFLFFVSMCDALLFNGLLVHFYEGYLHARYPRDGSTSRSNYTVGKYSLILSLGVSSVALLFVAAVWTARIVAWTL